MESSATPLLSVDRLHRSFTLKKDWRGHTQASLEAVSSVSFELHAGETLAIVGESGCGKSTLARLILRLLRPTSGTIRFMGQDIHSLDKQGIRQFRQAVQLIFQDSRSSLNPRRTVEQTLSEALELRRMSGRGRPQHDVGELLQLVGIPSGYRARYPHELSGGQCQRIGIARALAVEPKLIVCDEPTSALDVSIQAQIIELLLGLQDQFGFSYLFISHNLAVVRYISDRVAVMYLGKIVEMSDTQSVFSSPLHPYTRALLSAAPVPVPGKKRPPPMLKEGAPNSGVMPTGCRFHPRCPFATDICTQKEPKLEGSRHLVACHHVDAVRASGWQGHIQPDAAREDSALPGSDSTGLIGIGGGS